jgi:hypothetical protein
MFGQCCVPCGVGVADAEIIAQKDGEDFEGTEEESPRHGRGENEDPLVRLTAGERGRQSLDVEELLNRAELYQERVAAARQRCDLASLLALVAEGDELHMDTSVARAAVEACSSSSASPSTSFFAAAVPHTIATASSSSIALAAEAAVVRDEDNLEHGDDPEHQDSVWDALTKLVSDIDVKDGDGIIPKTESNVPSAVSSPMRVTAAADSGASTDQPGAQLERLRAPAQGNNVAALSIESVLENNAVATTVQPKMHKADADDSQQAHKSDALSKIEAMSKFQPPPAAWSPSKYDVSDLMRGTTAISSSSEQHARKVFQSLKKDFTEAAFAQMVAEVGKNALSRDKLAVLLEASQGVRLTCSQLQKMVELCSLDAHKKAVIYQRYAQISNKDKFADEVLNNFTRSNSLRSTIMKELDESLDNEDAARY